MKTLLSWTDRTLRRSHHAPRRANDEGPLRRAIRFGGFERLILLVTPITMEASRELADSLSVEVELVVVDVSDPSDHEALFLALSPLFYRWSGVTVLLSAGTPQAQTLWVISVQAGLLDAKMIQVIPPQFVPNPHPFPIKEVSLNIEGFPTITALKKELSVLRQQTSHDGLIGGSLGPLKRRIARVAPTDVPVVILGETGTGKELIAQQVQRLSLRSEGPFVTINAGALTESVLSSQLFGHEQGAFTSAHRRHRGVFEQAHLGTLFIDEVGEMPPFVQVMLLRVLETGLVRPVGAEHERSVNVRLVAASHRNLREEVNKGRFREDLYYRLNGAELTVPPLRERVSDLRELVRHFLPRELQLHSSVWPVILSYAWPGNVRQLASEVRRWALWADDEVALVHLSPEVRGVPEVAAAAPHERVLPLRQQVAAVERVAIEQALVASKGNVSAAARLLGIDRHTLVKKRGVS